MPNIAFMETQALIAEIERYCANEGIAETTFGLRAVNDGKLVNRLRAGKTITLATFNAITATLSGNTPEPPSVQAAD